MTTSNDKAQREEAIPGQPHLIVRIYGADKAGNLWEAMDQGFSISRAGVLTARNELTDVEREAVRVYMEEHHPEHAKL